MRGEMVEDGRTERDLSNVRVRKRLQYITNINKSPPPSLVILRTPRKIFTTMRAVGFSFIKCMNCVGACVCMRVRAFFKCDALAELN